MDRTFSEEEEALMEELAEVLQGMDARTLELLEVFARRLSQTLAGKQETNGGQNTWHHTARAGGMACEEGNCDG